MAENRGRKGFHKNAPRAELSNVKDIDRPHGAAEKPETLIKVPIKSAEQTAERLIAELFRQGILSSV